MVKSHNCFKICSLKKCSTCVKNKVLWIGLRQIHDLLNKYYYCVRSVNEWRWNTALWHYGLPRIAINFFTKSLLDQYNRLRRIPDLEHSNSSLTLKVLIRKLIINIHRASNRRARKFKGNTHNGSNPLFNRNDLN